MEHTRSDFATALALALVTAVLFKQTFYGSLYCHRRESRSRIDLAVVRETAITGLYNLKFLVEGPNLFSGLKSLNPDVVATNAANSPFLVISGQANTSRLLQLAMRLRF